MYNDSDCKKWDDLHEEIQFLWDSHRNPRCTEHMRARQVNKIMQMEPAPWNCKFVCVNSTQR